MRRSLLALLGALGAVAYRSVVAAVAAVLAACGASSTATAPTTPDPLAGVSSSASFSVEVTAPATLTIHLVGMPAIHNLDLLLSDWLDDHDVVSSTPACSPGQLAGELFCGPLPAGSHDVVLVGRRKAGATRTTYRLGLADVTSESTSHPLAKDTSGHELSVSFSE